MFFIWMISPNRNEYYKYPPEQMGLFPDRESAEAEQDKRFFKRWMAEGGDSVVLPADELPVFNVEYPR